MFKRKAVALLAACVLGMGTMARADQSAGTAGSGSYNPSDTTPSSLDDQATSAPTSAPSSQAAAAAAPADAAPSSESAINDAAGKVGIGKALGDWGIKLGGFIEGSYTYNTSSSNQDIAGRFFDFENWKRSA